MEVLSSTRQGDAVAALVQSLLALCVDGRLVIEPRAWASSGARVSLEALVSARLIAGKIYRNV